MFGNLSAPDPGPINPNHPLAQGLVFAMPGWTPNDVVGGLKGTLNGSMATTIGPYGPAFNQGGTSSYISYQPVGAVTDAIWQRSGLMGGPVTVMVVHTPASTTNASLFNWSDNQSGQSPFCMMWSEANQVQKYSFWNDDYGPSHGATDPNTAALNVPHCVIGRRYGTISASPNMDLWIDGAQVAAASSVAEDSFNVSSAGGSSLLCINRFGGYNGYYGTGTIHAVYAWSRALSDVECLALTEDPWCLFRSTSQDAVEAPAGAYTLACAAGTLTVSGKSANLLRTLTLPCAVGSKTLTGQDASPLRGYPLTAGTGTKTLSGSAAALSSTGALHANVGGYNIFGQQASLLWTPTLSCAVGSKTLSGQAAGLLRTLKTTASTGSYTVSGQTSSLKYGHVLTASTGALTLSGKASGLIYGTGHILVAQGGAHSVSGQASVPTTGRRLVAATGSRLIAGEATALVHSGASMVGTIFELGELLMVALSQLTDVQITSLADGDTIYFDNSVNKWINVHASQVPTGSVTFAFIGGSPLDNAALAALLNAKFSATNQPTTSQVSGFATDVDARIDTKISTHTAAVDPHPGYLGEDEAAGLYASVNHSHNTGDTWLANALATKEDTGVAATTVNNHELASDPHTQYYDQSRGDARYSQLGHTHAALKLDDLATPDDNTDLNATTVHHGLLPKLSGDANQALKGDGTWATVASGSPDPVVVSEAYSVDFFPATAFSNNDYTLIASSTAIAVPVNTQVQYLDLSGTDTLDFQVYVNAGIAGSQVALQVSTDEGSTWLWLNNTSGATAPASPSTAGAISTATAGLKRLSVAVHSSLRLDQVRVRFAGWGDGTNIGTVQVRRIKAQRPMLGVTGPQGSKGDKGDPGANGLDGLVTSVTSELVVSSGTLSLKRDGKIGRYTTNANVGVNESFVIMAASSVVTATLPSDTNIKFLAITNRGTASVTIAPATGQTINGGNISLAAATGAQAPSTLCLVRDPSSNAWWVH